MLGKLRPSFTIMKEKKWLLQSTHHILSYCIFRDRKHKTENTFVKIFRFFIHFLIVRNGFSIFRSTNYVKNGKILTVNSTSPQTFKNFGTTQYVEYRYFWLNKCNVNVSNCSKHVLMGSGIHLARQYSGHLLSTPTTKNIFCWLMFSYMVKLCQSQWSRRFFIFFIDQKK